LTGREFRLGSLSERRKEDEDSSGAVCEVLGDLDDLDGRDEDLDLDAEDFVEDFRFVLDDLEEDEAASNREVWEVVDLLRPEPEEKCVAPSA